MQIFQSTDELQAEHFQLYIDFWLMLIRNIPSIHAEM